jgi:hypothetical protein
MLKNISGILLDIARLILHNFTHFGGKFGKSLLLGDDFLCDHTAKDAVSILESDIDPIAKMILQNFTGEHGNPLKTSGNGDCLFDAASLYLVGNETKSVELRYKTALMLINEENVIRNHKDKASLKDLSPSYDSAVRDCAQIGKYSSQWTIIALAKVLNMPIKVIYPSVGGHKGLAHRTLNAVYNVGSSESALLTIMWTSMKAPTSAMISGRKWWSPNHFVPVISAMESNLSSTTGKELSTSSVEHLSSSTDVHYSLSLPSLNEPECKHGTSDNIAAAKG